MNRKQFLQFLACLPAALLFPRWRARPEPAKTYFQAVQRLPGMMGYLPMSCGFRSEDGTYMAWLNTVSKSAWRGCVGTVIVRDRPLCEDEIIRLATFPKEDDK